MIEKYSEKGHSTFGSAIQPVKSGRRALLGFVASVALVGAGAVAAVWMLETLPSQEPGAPSTAQQLFDIISPSPTEADNERSAVMTERRGTRFEPVPEEVAAAPQIDAAPAVVATAGPAQNDISLPILEDMVTRSIGSLATAPIGLTLATPEIAAAPAPAAAPIVIDPNQLFTASSSTSRTGCIDDLRSLTRDTRVYFPSGGVSADEQGLVQARLIGFVAQTCPGVVVQVEGHSDPSGDPAVNLRLSEQRAQTVVARLAAAGVDTTKFRAVGFGDRQPSLIRGTEPAAYYDRRVEFSVVQTSVAAPAASVGFANARTIPACVAQLQEASARTRLFFAPGSVIAPQSDLTAVYQLAAAASACPEARLRVIGQFSDDLGSGETPSTARLRAIALMSGLVASGFAPEQIIIAAPSRPTVLANSPGISERRIDFDIILEEL